jgi:hypothetical protein
LLELHAVRLDELSLRGGGEARSERDHGEGAENHPPILHQRL